jgi:hypothetical protein
MQLSTLSKNLNVIEFLENFKDDVFLNQIYKIEHSAKITKDTISSDRVSLQFNKNQELKIRKILEILRKYNFPTDKYDDVKNTYSVCSAVGFGIDISNVGFGIDISNSNPTYKIYFEYADYHKILGIKWDALKYDVTHYLQKDKKNFIEVIKETNFDIIPKFNSDIIGIYYIHDENSNRNGFDLTFETGDVFLKDIPKNILDITTKNIDKELSHLKEYPIRHFSGGVDKNNAKYFNLYFVTNEYTYELGHG